MNKWRQYAWLWIVVAGLGLATCDPPDDVKPSVRLFTQDNFPSSLSEWGVLLVRQNRLVLNDGVIAYDLNTPLFTDYAHKLRTYWIPNGENISYSAVSDLQFPIGSVITKTFYYPTAAGGMVKTADYSSDFAEGGLNLDTVRLIETRVMIKLDDGWHGLPYVWNQTQTDANLNITGDAQQLSLRDGEQSQNFIYVVPDANQCQACHVDNMTTKQMRLLGLKTRHVNKAYSGIFATDNQLQHWRQLGKLNAMPNNIVSNANWRDSTQPLNQRAMAYLDINCGHCHNPAGPADTSALYLSNDQQLIAKTDPVHLGICKPPVAAGQGTGGHNVGIYPGNADKSIFIYRMASLDLGAMMPELGRSLVHEEGVALIKQWINAMSGDCR